MLRRLRHPSRPHALVASLLLVPALVAGCGSEQTVLSGSEAGLDAVDISGDVGSGVDVEWSSTMSADTDPDVSTVTEGDGAALEDGQTVLVNYYVGNGFTEKTAIDTYGADDLALSYPVGGEVPPPTSAQATPEQQARYFLDSFVATQIEAGDTVGTRKAIAVSSEDVLGYGGGGLGIGNQDALLIVVDIVGVALDGPDGTSGKRPGWVPGIELAKSLPASLDFNGVPEPDGSLKVAELTEGTGEDVEKDDLIVVNYLGQVYEGDKPFDESYSRGTTFATGIGQGAVVQGWDQGLVGVPVGSRVMLEIPPKLGYGEQAQGDAIPGGSTLYFVIDILGAA